MARVFGPALSIDAKKSIGKAITYQARPRGTAVIQIPTPSRRSLDEPSLPKCNQRTIMGLLVAHWQCMTAAEKAVWEAEAVKMGAGFTGYHAFIKKAQENLLGAHGLVGYWSMNEAAGGQVLDYSGLGNYGGLKPTYPTNCPVRIPSINKQYGNALKFDGLNDYVDLYYRPEYDIFGSDFTAELWASWTTTGTPTQNGILNFGYFATTFILGLGFREPSTLSLRVAPGNTGAWAYWLGPTGLNNGRWHHIVVTRQGATIKLYVDLAPYNYFTAGTIDVSTYNRIGHGYYGYFGGLIDEVRIYNRALSAAEIKKHFYLFRN